MMDRSAKVPNSSMFDREGCLVASAAEDLVQRRLVLQVHQHHLAEGGRLDLEEIGREL